MTAAAWFAVGFVVGLAAGLAAQWLRRELVALRRVFTGLGR